MTENVVNFPKGSEAARAGSRMTPAERRFHEYMRDITPAKPANGSQQQPAERATMGPDPALVLVTERNRLWDECNRRDKPLTEDAFDALVDKTGEACDALEEQIADTIATSPAGIIAQVQLLANGSMPLDDQDVADRLAASIATGIRALANGRDPAGGDITLCEADAALIAAEQRIAAIVRGTQDGDQEEVERLEDYIDGTGPQSLAGAPVKLRRLADPNQLLCNADYDRDLARADRAAKPHRGCGQAASASSRQCAARRVRSRARLGAPVRRVPRA